MEIDTGSACTIINEVIYEQRLHSYKLVLPSVKFKSYSGQRVDLVGECNIPVRYGDQRFNFG